MVLNKAIHAVVKMLQNAVVPDEGSLINAIKACTLTTNIESGFLIHSYLTMDRTQLNPSVYNTLMDMYGKCGSIQSTCRLFDHMVLKNAVSWTVMITTHAKHGHAADAVRMLYEMEKQGLVPREIAYMSALNACAGTSALDEGRGVHVSIIKFGAESDIQVGSALVDMYSKCLHIIDARKVWEKMAQRDVVSWNSMIVGYALQENVGEAFKLFTEMQEKNVNPDQITYVSLLKACAIQAALMEGKHIHNQIMHGGIQPNIILGNALIDMYIKCGDLEDAREVFNSLSNRNVVSWTSLITGYYKQKQAEEALELYQEMQVEMVKPNEVTLLNVISACAYLGASKYGKYVHMQVIEEGFNWYDAINNSLLSMYANCGSVMDASEFFKKIPRRNIICWTTMISTYVHAGHAQAACDLFDKMINEGVKPDDVTYVSIIKACTTLVDVNFGLWINKQIIKHGYEANVFVGSALIDMYSKCQSIEDAHAWFQNMPRQNVVSWTAIVGGYVQVGKGHEALDMFGKMQQQGSVKPNAFTLMTALNACAMIGAVEEGKQIHFYVVDIGLEVDAFVNSALIDMYSKCGSLVDARQLLRQESNKNVVCWTAMMAGYALYGDGEQVLRLADKMQKEGIPLNHVTFIHILSACSHTGLLEVGLYYFDIMRRVYGISPSAEHFSCMVDIFGRAGNLKRAAMMAKAMPRSPSAVVWRAFLAACRMRGDAELAKYAADQVTKLQPDDTAAFVLLSNSYATAGRWGEKARVMKSIAERGLVKDAGQSCIEVSGRVHVFVADDAAHPEIQKVHAELERLLEEMKVAGYVPDTRFALHDVEDELKEYSLSRHSEKLAIVFGLLSTPSVTPIRIIKNLRVCGDCHTAAKYISKLAGREIYLRDAHRYHHFRDGVCSCGDYW